MQKKAGLGRKKEGGVWYSCEGSKRSARRGGAAGSRVLTAEQPRLRGKACAKENSHGIDYHSWPPRIVAG